MGPIAKLETSCGLKNNKGFLKEEYELTYNAINKVLKKQGPWGRELDDVRKNFEWQFEEVTAIRSAQNKNRLYEEMKVFMKEFELKKVRVNFMFIF